MVNLRFFAIVQQSRKKERWSVACRLYVVVLLLQTWVEQAVMVYSYIEKNG